MSDLANRLREAAIARVLRGPGHASGAARQAAFDNAGVDDRARVLIDKVARTAWKVTDDDVAAAKASGLSEDEIFELVVCAAFGQASRQLRSGLDAIDRAVDARKREHP
jgi:hypothetical protein